jgi:hypothetical protein
VKSYQGLINYAPLHEDVWLSGGITPPFLTSALDGGVRSASRFCRFTQGETAPGTDCTGGGVGPRAGIHVTEKRNFSCPCREPSHDFSVQPLVSSIYRMSYPREKITNVGIHFGSILIILYLGANKMVNNQ